MNNKKMTATVSLALAALFAFMSMYFSPGQTVFGETAEISAASRRAAPELGSSVVRIGVIGMAGGAYEALRSFEKELSASVSQLAPQKLKEVPPPDLSEFDLIYAAFADKEMTEIYRARLSEAHRKNPGLKVFAVGPAEVSRAWVDLLGGDNIAYDPEMAKYYGISKPAMKEMVRYSLIRYFGRPGEISPPGAEKAVKIYHPELGEFDSVETFLTAAGKNGVDVEKCPRVALGSWRHHCLFHQPKVIDAIIGELKKRGILSVCLIADDPGFRERIVAFKPDVVIQTSHTNEPADFWEKLGAPRIHTLWFMDESIAQWRKSANSGMRKSEMQHLIVFAEARGATECLAAAGTVSGGNSGEEMIPIEDRIARIAGRVEAWIKLRRAPNADKRIIVVTYDREADKSGLMNGPLHDLNAPRSMVRFLNEMKRAGYDVKKMPADDAELLAWMMESGRQMGSWEPGALDKLARSGKAILVPEEKYVEWYEKFVPAGRRAEVEKNWGPAPGRIMVWHGGGKKYLVLPVVQLGKVIIATQPPKGETITASAVLDTVENLLPPTHHYLATYLWFREGFKADAVVHFGSHGSEWLFPGKPAVISSSDWSDILIGDMPNINPWLCDNIAELLPCKRRAMAVNVDYLPPLLINAGLSDELLNLESTIEKWEALEPGALKNKFAADISVLIVKNGLDAELKLKPSAEGGGAAEDIGRVSKYLHDLKEEFVPASMHVLGQKPPDDLLIPYLVHCMGKKYLKAASAVFPAPSEATREAYLKMKGGEVLLSILRKGLSPDEAVRACGGCAAGDTLPAELAECLNLAAGLDANIAKARLEIDNTLAALEGKFIPPGPSGTPERNPEVVPTGRNLFVLNPQELPARSSWELGCRLIDDYLKNEMAVKGRYPKKIAFSLVPFAAYTDYGIIESQIMYLMGVRPVWDEKNRIKGVELIPSAELGRPRIDVFLSVRAVYRDELPHMMKLLDRAVRLAASAVEKDNFVREYSEKTRAALEKRGIPAAKASLLSFARMFGSEPKEVVDGHNWFFYLSERSGEWGGRRELLDVYYRYFKHVYTQGAWGDNAPEAFDAAIGDTELIFRSWYDGRDFVLGNKFTWWADGTLSMAVKDITGREPDYMFVDVRDPQKAAIVDSTDMLRRDLRMRVMNPKWIAGMMNEGYAGGNAMARNIDNLMGWEITRAESVSDENWLEVYDTYVRDAKNTAVRSWMDRENPHAFQKMTGTLLETIRKDFWKPSPEVTLGIAKAYADSVVRHGPNGGVREGGNRSLESFTEKVLAGAGTKEARELAEKYKNAVAAAAEVDSVKRVQGKTLEKKDENPPPQSETERADGGRAVSYYAVIVLAALLITLCGYAAGPFISRRWK